MARRWRSLTTISLRRMTTRPTRISEKRSDCGADSKPRSISRPEMPHFYAKAFAPATVANVGPGFDVFGFALEGAGDTVELRFSYKKGVRIREISGDGGLLPAVPSR